MRPSCPYCAAKHISQAIILFSEAAQGYPPHWYLALGHLAEAGDELISKHPEHAAEVREVRKQIEGFNGPEDMRAADTGVVLMTLLHRITLEIDKHRTRSTQTKPQEDAEEIERQFLAREAGVLTAEPSPAPAHLVVKHAPPVIPPAAPCTPCQENARRLREAQAALDESIRAGDEVRSELVPMHVSEIAQMAASDNAPDLARTVIILTTLSNFDPSYSLSTCIQDQANALAISGHDVHLHVHEGCVEPEFGFMAGVTIHKDVPSGAWGNDRIDAESVQRWFGFIKELFAPVQRVVVISHDLLFQSAYVSIAQVIHDAASGGFLRSVDHWYHVAHSSVGNRPQTADIPSSPVFLRTNLPEGPHSLVVLSAPDVAYFRDHYKKVVSLGSELKHLRSLGHEEVSMIHNIRDVRSFCGFSKLMREFTTDNFIVDALVVTYPISAPRMMEKGVLDVVYLVGEINRVLSRRLDAKHRAVRLVLAAGHANNTDEMTPKLESLRIAVRDAGLVWGIDVLYTPELFPETAVRGLLASDMRALWQLTDVFMFPSISEAGSLVLLEAQASGAVLVLNECLASSASYIHREDAIWVPWGSTREPKRMWDMEEVASRVLNHAIRRDRNRAGSWESLGRMWTDEFGWIGVH